MSIIDSNFTYASNQGNIKVSISKFIDYYKDRIRGLKYFYYYFKLKYSSFDDLFALGQSKQDIIFFYWVFTNKSHIIGCINPCIVIDDEKGLLAAYADLATSEYYEPVHSIKIFDVHPYALQKNSLKNGDKIACVALYSSNKDEGNHKSWGDISPSVPIIFAQNESDVIRAKESISELEWKFLDFGLNSIESTDNNGLFHFEATELLNNELNLSKITQRLLSIELSDNEANLAKKISFPELIIKILKKESESEVCQSESFDENGELDEDLSLIAIKSNISQGKINVALDNLRKNLAGQGYFSFVSKEGYKDDDSSISILKAVTQFDILRFRKTNGINHNVDNDDVINKLTEWDKAYGINIISVDFDLVSFHIENLPQDLNAFAKEVYEFCPDIIDQGFEDINQLIEALKYSQYLQLWWD